MVVVLEKNDPKVRSSAELEILKLSSEDIFVLSNFLKKEDFLFSVDE